MTALESFIVRMIVGAAVESIEKGKAKYTAYFVDTSIYQGSRVAWMRR